MTKEEIAQEFMALAERSGITAFALVYLGTKDGEPVGVGQDRPMTVDGIIGAKYSRITTASKDYGISNLRNIFENWLRRNQVFKP